MHLGTIATIATSLPKNLIHIVLNNGCHESVGGLPSAADTVSLSALLEAAGYPSVSKVTTANELRQALTTLETGDIRHLKWWYQPARATTLDGPSARQERQKKPL